MLGGRKAVIGGVSLKWIRGEGYFKTGRSVGSGLLLRLFIYNEYIESANRLCLELEKKPVEGNFSKPKEGVKLDFSKVKLPTEGNLYNFKADISDIEYQQKERKIELYAYKSEKHIAKEMMNELQGERVIWAFRENNSRQQEIINRVSNQQIKLIHVIINTLSFYFGESPYTKKPELLKEFDWGYEHVSDMPKAIGTRFINFLLWSCNQNGVEIRGKEWNEFDLVTKQVVNSILQRKCVACGKDGELVQWDDGIERVCLCKDHQKELEIIKFLRFAEKYHIQGVEIKI